MKYKSCPPDFPDHIEIPMGMSWSHHNCWTVRRKIKGVDSKPMYFKKFEDALKYHAHLFADKIEKENKFKNTLKYSEKILSKKKAQDMLLREATLNNDLSIDNLDLLTREEVKKKINLYIDRLEILYARDTELWIKECESHGF